MKQHTIDTFSFNELSETAKQKALQALHDINTDFDWYQYTIDDFVKIMENIGFYDIKISFSGFYSQGDGASFSAMYRYEKGAYAKVKKLFPQYSELHDITKQLQEIQKQHGFKLRCVVSRSRNYAHEYSMSISDLWHDNKDYDHDFKDSESDLLEVFRQLAREIYSTLQKEYEYLTSAEAITEAILVNEYQFTEDGKLFN